MVRQAREMVADGAAGRDPRRPGRVPPGLAAEPLEETGTSRPAGAPTRRGRGRWCVGDIGTHAYNLADFVTGLRLEAVAAELRPS